MTLQPVFDEYTTPNFPIKGGGHFNELRQGFITLGDPQRDSAGDITNAVLLLHNTTGTSREWLAPDLGGELFGPGQPLDASRHFLIMPDAIGFGRSSKPSEGLRAHFPNFRYEDMVIAQHRLLTEKLGIRRLRMILGLSMGGMLTWLWGGLFPHFAERLIPIACQPAPMSGRNWLQRRMQIELIRNDPGWNGGDYVEQPSYYSRAPFGALMTQSVVDLQRLAPTRKAADALYARLIEKASGGDACDRLYQLEASMDYDPTPLLEKVEAPVFAINFADDELNPAALGTLEAGIAQVKHAQAVVLPAGADSKGHHSALRAALWKAELQTFLLSR